MKASCWPRLLPALLLAACGSSTPKFDLPLGSASQGILSRRGAHSYLLFDPAAPQGPGLFWRQHGDMLAGLGTYRPVLAPLYSVADPQGCALVSHQWRAADVERRFSCGALTIDELVTYADASTVAVRLRIENTSKSALSFTLAGQSTEPGLLRAVSPFPEEGRLQLRLAASLENWWSGPTPIRWPIEITARPKPAALEASLADGWRMRFEVPGRDEQIIALTIALDEQSNGHKPFEPKEIVSAVEATAKEISAWLREAPEQNRLGDRAYAESWYLFWENTAAPNGNWTHEAITPSKRQYFRGAWLWDEAFNVVALSQGGSAARALARSQVDLFMEHPFADGHLPREIWCDSINTDIQPPGVMTWASLTYANKSNDSTHLAGDYAVLKGNHQWFLAKRDTNGNGLWEWDGMDSGWDNSPRWDGGLVEAVDLASWLYLDAVLLGQMAELLGNAGEAAAWRDEASRTRLRIQQSFWDAADGLFYDLTLSGAAFVRVVSPATFMPLFVGAATQDQARKVAEALADPARLGSPYPLPTVGVAASTYDSKSFWRGPTWVVTNALAVWGLEQYGLFQEADALRQKTLQMIAQFDTTCEYYDSQSGACLGAPNFMWTGAFYVLLQQPAPTVW